MFRRQPWTTSSPLVDQHPADLMVERFFDKLYQILGTVLHMCIYLLYTVMFFVCLSVSLFKTLGICIGYDGLLYILL